VRFKIDENMPAEAAELLRRAGDDAVSVADEQLCGADDETLAERFQAEGRALITLDLDFADIRAYPPQEYAGIIVLRSRNQLKPVILALMRRLVPLLKTERLSGCLWVVGHDRVRMIERTNM
jgi:predicted nuclease of predicted toxin-antitoxin system